MSVMKREDLKIGTQYIDKRDHELVTLLDIGSEYVTVDWMGYTVIKLDEFLKCYIPCISIQIKDLTNELLETLRKNIDATIPVSTVIHRLNSIIGSTMMPLTKFEEEEEVNV